MPSFLKNIMVLTHRNIRTFGFYFTKDKSTKNCKENKEKIIKFQKSRKYGPLKRVCYAPYTSMFFARNGKVSPCYASYNENSDRITDKSIKEIWFKGSINKIREEHKNCELEKSCNFCKKLMLQESFGSLLTNKYDHYAFSIDKYPKIMEFEISNRCNLSCIMCDSNLSSSIAIKKNSKAYGNLFYKDDFFEQLDEFIPHLHLAEFTGGDPFMIEEYYKIWDKITKLNHKCQILITTNANTMNDRIKNLLAKHKNINFNVSIDSLDEQNYANIRQNGNLKTALKNIDFFVEYTKKNNTNLNILVCPLTVNRHELHKFVDFANKKDVCVYYHTVVKPKELSLKYLEKEELLHTINQLEEFSAEQRTAKQKTNYRNFKNLITLLKNWYSEKEDKPVDNKDNKPLNNKELIELINLKTGNDEQLKNKLKSLLEQIKEFENYNHLINELVKVDNDIFIDYLSNKSIEELKQICSDINDKA